MPQLNPLHWFNMFMFSWMAFGTILPLKIKNISFPNSPELKGAEKPLTESWAWPWL
uniref:ATP synthase complex subunit 8 n=1 Tax=Hoplolatilus cuniculus TaxID=1206906 RepID=A0A060NU67_9TELE|nr:ATP synthase F0 subunit 8 [Hoplolatilus cuniculus]BAO84840.1 ATPase subunit 8 [Hoplolatilus cuniculus]